MCYVICSNPTKGGYVVCRNYLDKYRCRDYIAPLTRDYFGKYSQSAMLSFDTQEAAQRYLMGHNGLIPHDWHIRKYDPCMNSVL